MPPRDDLRGSDRRHRELLETVRLPSGARTSTTSSLWPNRQNNFEGCFSHLSEPHRPIDSCSVQLPSKTCMFFEVFQPLSRVRGVESSGVLERAMGIEPTSEAWTLEITRLKTLELAIRH